MAEDKWYQRYNPFAGRGAQVRREAADPPATHQYADHPPDQLEAHRQARGELEAAAQERWREQQSLWREDHVPIQSRAMDIDSRMRRQDLDVPVNGELVDWEIDQMKWIMFYVIDEENRTFIDHWKELSEEEKLARLMKSTSVAGIPSRQAREILGREVDFGQIPEDRQREVMGEHFERIAPPRGPN